MDPHVAEALKTMSKGVNEFTKSSSKAIDGLTSKIDTMSGTVTIMQEQLKKQAENLETVMGQVGEASKSSTSTSKALKKFADKAHDGSNRPAPFCDLICKTCHQVRRKVVPRPRSDTKELGLEVFWLLKLLFSRPTSNLSTSCPVQLAVS